ncbi:MAG: hypothetical protein ACRDTU_22180 [Micromonosporaceae bacterium]
MKALLSLTLVVSGCSETTRPRAVEPHSSESSVDRADPRFTEARLTVQEQQQVCLAVTRALREELKPRRFHGGNECEWRWDMGGKELGADIDFVAVDGGGHYARKYGRATSECLLYSEPDDREWFLHSAGLMRTGSGDFCAQYIGGAGEERVAGDFTLRRTQTFVAVYGWSHRRDWEPLSDDELIPARDLIVSVARKEMAG